MSINLPAVLDVATVADLLDCEPETVQEKARAGILPGVKFGRSWRFPQEALLQRINELALENSAPRREQPSATVAVAQPRMSRRKTRPTLP